MWVGVIVCGVDIDVFNWYFECFSCKLVVD